MQINDMQFSFERIWHYFDFGEHQEVILIKIKLSNFFQNFTAFHNLRKNSVLNEMILIPNHTNNDKQILEKIEENHLRDELLHSSDEKILFDANEFCKNNADLKLKFVTADQDFFKAIEILMDYLCFDECINLMEFTNN